MLVPVLFKEFEEILTSFLDLNVVKLKVKEAILVVELDS